MIKMKAVILAAGYATRLYPLTENKPKCLLTVGGRTILDSIAAKIERTAGCEEIVIVTNAKFYDRLEMWKKGAKHGLPVRIINDGTTSNQTRLGAIGDLGLALNEAKIDTDVLMMASDNLFDQELDDFVRFAQSRPEAVTIAVYDIHDPKLAANKFGVVEADKTGKVISLEEKPAKPKTSVIGMGVYYFPASSLPKVHEYLADKNAKDAPGHYVRWLSERTTLFSFAFQGMWYDIGDLNALDEADRLFKTK
jgi:glucose-1-phosphate thymidylyltransferase